MPTAFWGISTICGYSPTPRVASALSHGSQHAVRVTTNAPLQLSRGGNFQWPEARMYAMYAFDAKNGAFWIFSGEGGAHGAYLPDMWRFDLARMEFEHMGDFTEPAPRMWANFWSGADGMWVFAGVNGKSQQLNDMWHFNYTSTSWRKVYDRGNNPCVLCSFASRLRRRLPHVLLATCFIIPPAVSVCKHMPDSSNAAGGVCRYGVYNGSDMSPGARHNAFTAADR